ncbi:hypothetical protein [Neobacillus sp. YIM B06451]|uniref:hypothetical protein n=1 Tax=Neobacillus sp. YIM B06451 TaxID=3070994 RepID=UPI00292CE079|nr:hypothetical protein [Neobacillus sp. YIM B06451]
MNKYRITYTLDSGKEITEFVDGNDPKEVLNKIETSGIKEFYDEKGFLHRIVLSKVAHISVFKYK